MTNNNMGAQNQHYVPKFILRNFLFNESREQVSVFRKSNGKGFVTSIRNVMAERRFHDFTIGEDFISSFEQSVCRIEDQILPTYRKVLDTRRIDFSDEERANLALLIAFQFVRTRQLRDQFVHMMQQLDEKLGDFVNCEPLTEDELKIQHIEFIKHSITDFTAHIAAKDILLLSAPAGRGFYLSDVPVTLHNNEPTPEFWSNIGLAVRGIQIYLPLSSDLMLAAWCPSLLQQVRETQKKQDYKSELVSRLMRNEITPELMKSEIHKFEELNCVAKTMIANIESGIPVSMTEENMDFSNSLQLNYAREYVICKNGNFSLAKRFMQEFPEHVGQMPLLR